MDFSPLEIPDVVLITPRRFSDDRGWFSETFRQDRLEQALGRVVFVQDNHSLSKPVGTVRGLHYQVAPRAQGKLVRCVAGAILDVAVDIRPGSPTFGRHVSVELSAENGLQLWVPAGFAHGFSTLKPDSEIVYKVTDYYSAPDDRGIAWDDPDLGIDWRVDPAMAVLSEKDRRHPRLASLAG